ncbi:MAG: hypothetical protein GX565_11565 [Lentisphaerae bacterium]|jgi:hypothetical protein|nr:hypothetical protein [Lentisphaerota bacterium]
MKLPLALLTALVVWGGCRSAKDDDGPAAAALTPEACAALAPVERMAVVSAELKTIGTAVKAYRGRHDGRWPTSLSVLIVERLLPAGALISAADPSGGREGGVPDRYDTWQQSAETDEANSSFLYELSGAAATWDWKSYLAGKPTLAALDTDKNGEVSWQEAKLWQFAHGDIAQTNAPAAYASNRFPVVRCYWHAYPGSKDDLTQRSVISLAADLDTVLLSQPWWEKDLLPVTLR